MSEAQAPRLLHEAPQRRLLRLSLDLHDGPMQDLAAVGFALEQLRREIGELPEERNGLLEQVEGIRDQLIEIELTLRELATDEAGHARRESLAQLISTEIGRFHRRAGIEVHVDLDELLEPETESQRIALHRVLREALTNVHKHARASTVGVCLYERGDVMYLSVTDDGVGFEPTATSSAGIGLNGMTDRLRLLGSTLEISSRIGGPTTVTAAVRRWRPAA